MINQEIEVVWCHAYTHTIKHFDSLDMTKTVIRRSLETEFKFKDVEGARTYPLHVHRKI